MKYLQIEHTEWFNPEVLNQTWSIDKLNLQEDSIQNFEPNMKYWQIKQTG
jgi:D-serine dehydratase